MSLNLYDLLDVEESASTDEIKTAWKAAVADLDPTDRRFRAFNDAAAVLLDVDKRASYDAGLAAERAEEEAGAAGQGGSAAVSFEKAPADDVHTSAPSDDDEHDAHSAVVVDDGELAEDPVEADEGDEADPAASPDAASIERDTDAVGPAGAPTWALWVAAVLAVLGLALGLVMWVVPDEAQSPQRRADELAQIESAGSDAQAAASDVIVPLLGYDYRTMDEDLANLQAHQTEAMATRQAASWKALTQQAKKQKLVVTATAPYVALTRVSADGDRATVVAFIDQDVTKKSADPLTLRMWATLTLARDGGDWLLDDVCTEGDCS